MQLIAKEGDICKEEVDAIVNPANSQGIMGGGAAAAIKQKGGKEIEEEAMSLAPIYIGEAVATSAGKLPCKAVIHAPTMEEPAERIDAGNVRKAVFAALKTAEENEYSSIAMPGMGTGVGGVDKAEAAKAMVEAIRDYKFKYLEKIVIVDIDRSFIQKVKGLIA